MKRVQRNLARHTNGTYYLDIRWQGRQIRRSLETSNRREARARLRQELARLKTENSAEPSGKPEKDPELQELKSLISELLAKQISPAPKSHRPSFSGAVQSHFETLVTDSKRTKEHYATQRNKLLRLCPDWEDFDPARLWTQVQDELRQRAKNPKPNWTHAANDGASSLNMLVHYLRHFASWLEVRQWLDPAAKHSLEQLKLLKVNARRMEPPTENEMATLIAQIKAEDYSSGAFIAFLAYTGCRKAGGLNAHWSDWVDDDRKPTFTFREKGRTTRTVDLTEQGNLLLKELRSRGGIRPTKGYKQAENRIFPLGNSRIKRAQDVLKKWADAFELPTSFFHSFRHYFASRCLMCGVDEYTVAALLGDTVEMIRKHYGHLRSDHIQSEIKRVTL
jgi:integrase